MINVYAESSRGGGGNSGGGNGGNSGGGKANNTPQTKTPIRNTLGRAAGVMGRLLGRKA